jgi:2-dehydropantoate 2-reductase
MNARERINSGGILIVGTGALATLFAARLARAGLPITVLGRWPAGVQALREAGARLVDASGNEERYAVAVADDPMDCRGSRYALVLVKSWQTERAGRDLAECLTADGLALTLQNGLGNREALAARLGADRVLLGSTTTGATLLGPGLVKPGGEGKVSIEAHAGVNFVRQALESAGFKTEIVEDATSLVWGKLVINSAINPLTALLRVPNGQLLERPAARALMHALAKETAAVASAESVALAPREAVRTVENVALRTASNHSSMLQDVQRGAQTEIDAICGAVTRIGKRHHIATPMNQACWHLVKALTESPRGRPSPRA